VRTTSRSAGSRGPTARSLVWGLVACAAGVTGGCSGTSRPVTEPSHAVPAPAPAPAAPAATSDTGSRWISPDPVGQVRVETLPLETVRVSGGAPP
jgi:hypothetical protein